MGIPTPEEMRTALAEAARLREQGKDDFYLGKDELQELTDLQMYCVRASSMLPALSPIKLDEYYDVLIKLIEKQKLFYARIKLSDDPEAQQMAELMREMTIMLGAKPEQPIYEMFDELVERVNEQKKLIAPAVAEQKRLQEDT